MNEENPRRPALRHLEIFPVEIEGNQMVCLRDPSGYTDNTVVVSPAAMFILSLCDGSRTLLDIQAEFTRRFGEIIQKKEILGLIDKMDEGLLMEGTRFEEHRKKAEREYLGLDGRPSAFAGKAFPEDEPGLRDHLEQIFTADGEGRLPDLSKKGRTLRGAIAPHIDYERGGPTYGEIYRVIGEEAEGSLFVILGTAHSGTDRVYTATGKHFETPLGRMPTDRDSLERLARRYGDRLFTDEFAHRSEHSIEFQVVFLRYLFGDRDISILPILCGSFHEYVRDGRSPAEDPAVSDFIGALKETIEESGKKPFFVAGADLSHVGLKFGHSEAPTPESCARLKVQDEETLEFAAKGDAEGFYRSIQEEGDQRNVCGLPPIYTLLKVMDGPKGKLVKYAQSPDTTLPSVVSYAGVAYY